MRLLLLLSSFILTCNSNYDNEINLECKGKRYVNVTMTAYFPDYDDEDHEKGYQDKRGNELNTLQDYLDDRAPFVTLSMDKKLGIPYGTNVCISELNKHYGHRIRLEVRDFSVDLQGSGYKRVDICVRSEIDSYDLTVNGKVTLYFV